MTIIFSCNIAKPLQVLLLLQVQKRLRATLGICSLTPTMTTCCSLQMANRLWLDQTNYASQVNQRLPPAAILEISHNSWQKKKSILPLEKDNIINRCELNRSNLVWWQIYVQQSNKQGQSLAYNPTMLQSYKTTIITQVSSWTIPHFYPAAPHCLSVSSMCTNGAVGHWPHTVIAD